MNDHNRSNTTASDQTISDHYSNLTVMDHFAFIIYCALLCIPVYAIVTSAIKQDWLMMIVDLLFIPIGFVHGVLILLGLSQ